MCLPPGWDLILEGFHPAAEIRAIREAGMMGGDDGGQNFAEWVWVDVKSDPRAGRKMVAAGLTFATDIGLKFAGQLADIVQMSGYARWLTAAKWSGKLRCSRPDRREMMRQRLPSFDGLSL